MEGSVAKSIKASFNTVNGKYCCDIVRGGEAINSIIGFNTVNGKYCCDSKKMEGGATSYTVSIP